MNHIRYRAGYKYQLAENYVHQLPVVFTPSPHVDLAFLSLDQAGLLLVKSGYAWDGPSGPTIDTPDSLRASLVHDAIYQLIRLQLLAPECRHLADQEFHRMLLEDGMDHVRARLWYEAVEHFAASGADPKNERPVLTAPTYERKCIL